MTNLDLKIFDIFSGDWALVTAGPLEHFNTMTVSWGGLGTLWGKSAATVYVKPVRYTHRFLDQNEYFTLSFFSPEYKTDLALLGRLSGRDGDKLAQTALTAKALGPAVGFEQDKLTLLCKKIYRQDMITDTMPPEVIAGYYAEESPHTMFIGEVVEVIK